MISLDKLKSVKHLITHEKCSDGVASAMIIKDVLPDVKVTFVTHNTKLHLEMPVEEGMLFCDFTPPPARVKEFVEAGTICLDHHKQARDVVEAFGDLGVFGDEKKDPGVSGAVLAFREVWQPLVHTDSVVLVGSSQEALVRDFAEVIGVRDTWQKKDPRWEKACKAAEAVSFWPEEELVGLPAEAWAERLRIGDILYPRRLKSAKRSADNSYSFTTRRGTGVIVFSGTRASSDAAEYMGDEVDIVIGFSTFVEDDEPIVIFSTRSHSGYDVGRMCKSFGGGGHTAAAGFQYKMNTVPARRASWLERHFFQLLYRIPPGFHAVRTGHLHPFFLAEKLVREYEGE